SSRKLLISAGTGSSLRTASRAASCDSSRMMSLQRSMHSSQMNTDGPAISLRTSCWFLPQKEQCKVLSSLEPFLSGIEISDQSGRRQSCAAKMAADLHIADRPFVRNACLLGEFREDLRRSALFGAGHQNLVHQPIR